MIGTPSAVEATTFLFERDSESAGFVKSPPLNRSSTFSSSRLSWTAKSFSKLMFSVAEGRGLSSSS